MQMSEAGDKLIEDITAFVEQFKMEFPVERYDDLTPEQKDRIFALFMPYPEEWKKHETEHK
jgi:hypothetical protein